MEHDNGDQTYADHDWHKRCVYHVNFPPPLWGFFPNQAEAIKAISSVGMLDRLILAEAA